MKIKLIILLSFLFTLHCYSQQIENVNYKIDNNVMVVTYDLVNCPGNKLYDVKLTIIGDSGIYVPKSVSGDLENVYPGKNKRIEWNISNDNSTLKNNIKAIVEITNIFQNAHGTAPTANFTANLTNTTIETSIQLTDQSANNPTSWKWDFGDGRTSTDQNPTHLYTSPGNYTITLIVSNSYGSNQKIKNNYITTKGSAPVVDFTTNRTSATVETSIQFNDQSTNKPTSWLWDFGDGNTSTEKNPTHTYKSPNSYKITLTASNSYGSNQTVKDNYINIKIKITGKPSNAILSILLPGLGDVFVEKENNIVVYPIMLVYAGSAYMAIHNYNNYKSFLPNELSPTGYYSTLEYSRQSYYERFLISAGIASAILIADVIHVILRGTKNRKEQLGIANNNGKVKLYFAGTPNNYQIGLVKHF